MVLSLALLAVACTAVQVEESGELEPAELHAIVRELADATAAKSRGEVKVEEAALGRCAEDQVATCVANVSARMRCKNVILLRLFGGLSNVRVEAHRFSPGQEPVLEVRNLPRRGDRSEAVDRLTAIVAPLPELEAVATTAPPPPEAPSWVRRNLPWVVLGGAAVALAAGTAFQLSSADARSTVEGEVLDGARADELTSRTKTHGVVAQALFGTAGALAAAGLLLFAF